MQDEDFQDTPLDDVLGDAEAPVTEPAPAEPEPVVEAEPTGEPDPEQPEPDGTPPSEKPETHWAEAAYLDEKSKRQDYERRLQAYEQQMQAQQQQPDPQASTDDDLWWDDPKAAAEQQAAALRAEFASQTFQTKFGMSETIVRSQHEDYEAKAGLFEKALGGNPNHPLAQQMAADPNPALFAYNMGKQIESMQEIGTDPAAYEARVREKIMAEMQAGTPAQPPSLAASAPLSLAGVSSAPAQHRAAPDPVSLDQIFDD